VPSSGERVATFHVGRGLSRRSDLPRHSGAAAGAKADEGAAVALFFELKNSTASSKLPPVKLTHFFILVLLATFGAGCKKTETQTAANTNAPVYDVPTQAQPKLPTIKIYLGPETMDAELAVTPMEEATGLMYRTNITDETAMLFDLHQPMRASFWMTNCPMSLSAAYIGPDGVIEEIRHLEKNDNVPVVATNDNILFVLEVNDGWFTRHNIGAGTLIKTERGTLLQTFGQ
jgi:uncharacterized membrane protein (UPF0127 family)